ncbi:MAG: slipin family protein [Rhizobacter sp.]|nr:slipin family protein [Chlorobiales bacterium]
MSLFTDLFGKRLSVAPNELGFLYRRNVLAEELAAGIYERFDFNNELTLFTVPLTPKLQLITNQEVLTKDNIALRFSYHILYRITDGRKLITKVRPIYAVYDAEQLLHAVTQLSSRDKISQVMSEDLNEKRAELMDLKTEAMEKVAADLGITLDQVLLRDLTFPKPIQDLFAKQLESKIRAKADLENARTTVATARALKNASELMKDDDNIKFFQLLETLTKIAAKGNHTFMIGDLGQSLPKTSK